MGNADTRAARVDAACGLGLVRGAVAARLVVIWVPTPRGWTYGVTAGHLTVIAADVACLFVAAAGALRFASHSPWGRRAAVVAGAMFAGLGLLSGGSVLAELGAVPSSSFGFVLYQIATVFSLVAMLFAVHLAAVGLDRGDLSRRARVAAAALLACMVVIASPWAAAFHGAPEVAAVVVVLAVLIAFWWVLGAAGRAFREATPPALPPELPRAVVAR